MADRFVFFRVMANEIARKHGHFASFMPKPFADRTGSGAPLQHVARRPRDRRESVPDRRRPPRRGHLTARLPVHRGRPATPAGDHRRHRAHRQQLQAPGPQGQHVGLHVGAGLRELRQQQSDQLAARAARRRPGRVPRRRHQLQPVPGRGNGVGAGLEGVREGLDRAPPAPRTCTLQRHRDRRDGRVPAPPLARRGDRRVPGRQSVPGSVR